MGITKIEQRLEVKSQLSVNSIYVGELLKDEICHRQQYRYVFRSALYATIQSQKKRPYNRITIPLRLARSLL